MPAPHTSSNGSGPGRVDDDAPLWQLMLDPRGRIGRATWWWCGVAVPLGLGVLLVALADVAQFDPRQSRHVVNLLLLWPALAVSIKRWHDRDQSGWWVLVVLLPLIGWLWALVANGLLRGTPGVNRHGPEPEEVAQARAQRLAVDGGA